MKVLLVITKGEIGGAQNFVLTLARGLKTFNVDVSVASGDGDFLSQELKKSNIPFFYLKSLKKSRSPFLVFSFMLEIFRLIKKENFDVVHFNSMNTLSGVFLIKLFKPHIKSVFTVHGLSVLDLNYNASRILKFIFRLYYRFFINYMDNVVFVSKANLNESSILGVNTKNSVFIYNGLEFQPDYFLEKDEARKKISNLLKKDISNSFIVGSIGRLAYPKNYEFVLNNWRDIRKLKNNIKFILIGDGNEKYIYEKIIKESGFAEDIFLVGKIENAGSLVKSFDIFILPSIYEGLSLSLIEANRAGVNTIASRVGGNEEIIGVENCFKLNDKTSFLNILKDNLDKSKPDAKNNFLASDMVKSYLSLYMNES